MVFYVCVCVCVSPGAGCIFPTMQPGAKLTQRLEQIDVVTPDKVLRQVDDGAHQASLQREGGKRERERGLKNVLTHFLTLQLFMCASF